MDPKQITSNEISATIQKRQRIRKELDNQIKKLMGQTGLSRLEVLREMKVRLDEDIKTRGPRESQ